TASRNRARPPSASALAKTHRPTSAATMAAESAARALGARRAAETQRSPRDRRACRREEQERREKYRQVGPEANGDAPRGRGGEKMESSLRARRGRIDGSPGEDRADRGERSEQRVRVGDPAVCPERDGRQ